MTKTRSFSIYLLKDGVLPEGALKTGHGLEPVTDADNLPGDGRLFLLDTDPRAPWWRDYFGIQQPITQVGKGAIVFLPSDGRWFSLCFGHVAHNLLDTSYEYDFGLRVTLNSLDPKKLKSTDTLEPGASKRRRTQLPRESDLTFFDFDRDATVIKSLTGKVVEKHKDLFRHATGASNLRISSDKSSSDLVELCKRLLALYKADDFKSSFPDIQNITPVKDPATIALLNAQLLVAVRAKSDALEMMVPEIVDYHDNVFATFSGAGASLIYGDVYTGGYFEYLETNGFDIGTIELAHLRTHDLNLTNEEGQTRESYSVWKSLVFETTLAGDAGDAFHLSEGAWYKIDKNYLGRIRNYVDAFFVASDLPEYAHANEGAYNSGVATDDPTVVCLDRENIAAKGQTQVEPCDLVCVRDGQATLYHVKISTLSAQLSHLFNQGVNAMELLRLDSEAATRLAEMIKTKTLGTDPGGLSTLIVGHKYAVAFAIVSRKDPSRKSANLPLFSRISLMRGLKTLQLMGVGAKVLFVKDASPRGAGKKKTRKSRTVVPAAVA